MYDVVYLGRFHHQKGVFKMMKIWRKVLEKKPDAKMLMIGDGALLEECKRLADESVTFAGFKYSVERDNLIKQCRVVVHPATYDSGGMAMAECMAFGLPGVCFDLDTLRKYYEKGVVRVPCFNDGVFADSIIALLNNKETYNLLSAEALEYTHEKWAWKNRSEDVWNETVALLWAR